MQLGHVETTIPTYSATMVCQGEQQMEALTAALRDKTEEHNKH